MPVRPEYSSFTMKKILQLGCLAVLGISPLAAADLDSQLEGLQKVGEDFAAAASMGSANASLKALAGEYREFSNSFGSLQSYVQDNNYDQSMRLVQRWLSRTKNEQIKTALTELMATLKKQKEERDAKLTALVDEMLKGAATKLANADTPEKVGEIQVFLQELRDYDLNTSDRFTRILSDRVGRAINFLGNWQQVISNEQRGDYAAALQSLNNARSNSSSDMLIDTAAYAAKYKTLLEKAVGSEASMSKDSPIAETVRQTMASIKVPADANRALAVINNLSSFTSGQDGRLVNSLQNSLSDLVRLQSDSEAGAYGRIISATGGSSYPSPYSGQIEALKMALRIDAVAKANDLPDLGAPSEGEGFATFIRRKAVAAFDKKDWETLFTLLSVYSQVSGGGCARTNEMKQGVAAFLAGQQLEKAGQFSNAVIQYSLCIAELGKLVPRAEATAALKNLRQEHPEAFGPPAAAPASQ